MSAFSMVVNNYHWDIFTCDESNEALRSSGQYGFTDPENLEIFIRVTNLEPEIITRTIRQQLSNMYMISYGFDKPEDMNEISKFISMFLTDILVDSRNIMENIGKDNYGFDADDEDLIDLSKLSARSNRFSSMI